MPAPNSRPVHPCVMSIFEGTRGAEYSTWAYISTRPPETPNLVTTQGSTLRIYRFDESSGKLCEYLDSTTLAGNVCYLETLPAATSNSSVVVLREEETKEEEGQKNLEGRSDQYNYTASAADSLLVGFSGHPRLTIVSVEEQSKLCPTPIVLVATSLIDLTQALIEHSAGSVTPLEHDLVATSVSSLSPTTNRSSFSRVTTRRTTPINRYDYAGDRATLTVILGNGVAVACIDLNRLKPTTKRSYNNNKSGVGHADGGGGGVSGWLASEPYLLPLASLQGSVIQRTKQKGQGLSLSTTTSSASAATTTANSANSNVPSTGFGDIISATFLPGYSEPTVVLLHSNPSSHGRIWSGRLGRPHWQPATRYGMLVTAISVTVAHQRSAVLWSVEVPTDAISLHRVGGGGGSRTPSSTTTTMGGGGCLVKCANSFLLINNAGRIQDFVAVNGFVKSTCPSRLLELLQPNPKPFPKLAIQLDGSAMAFVSESAILLSIRTGGLYLLQLPSAPNTRSSGIYDKGSGNSTNDNNDDGDGGGGRMCLLPLGRTLSSCGNIASLISWPLVASASNLLHDKLQQGKGGTGDPKNTTTTLAMGLLFAGSMVGDSTLLGFCLEFVDFPWMENSTKSGKKIKLLQNEETDMAGGDALRALESLPSNVSPELDNIMTKEEDALYEWTGTDDTVELGDSTTTTSEGKRKLPRVRKVALLRALTALDSIIGLGPLGPSCEGPIIVPSQQEEGAAMINPDAAVIPGSPALVVPCGYGTSGGIGIVTTPGRDERAILSEVDCLGAESIFSLRSLGLVLVATADAGIRVMRLQKKSSEDHSEESGRNVDSDDLVELDYADCLEECNDTYELFTSAKLLATGAIRGGSFALVISLPRESQQYAVAILKERRGLLKVTETIFLPSQEDKDQLLSITPLASTGDDVAFACTWSVGSATLVVMNDKGIRKSFDISGEDQEAEGMDVDDDSSEKVLNAFYSSRRIVAADLFHAPSNFFETQAQREDGHESNEGGNTGSNPERMPEGEEDLYCISVEDHTNFGDHGLERNEVRRDAEVWRSPALFLVVGRQSGHLEVFSVPAINSNEEATPVWSANGCGHGLSSLSRSGSSCRFPRQHEVHVREMRFFYCGPAKQGGAHHIPGLSRPLCLAVETTAGDLHLYVADSRSGPKCNLRFGRVPLKNVARQSQEQTRFQAKLRRKKFVSVSPDEKSTFISNKLFRFQSLSEQDGLFAAVARPLWLLAERGRPTVIMHRLRHASPAGGKTFPVSGFCSDLDGVGTFLTVHDRVGRFGSQRLTLYQEISKVFHAEGLLPGGGVCLERIPLGVTVRRIQFLDDASVSSRCLYAMLVSRELDLDMSHLNDDGMTREERERIEQEKEAAKIKRQVEADLGGFDVEQEWVEEIEREDCFQVDKELGGAPPVVQRAYALWIVDAANKWMVLDSYELGEFDHGMTMRVMTLTDFPEEPGSSSTSTLSSEDMDSKLFIAVGVGIVDKNGEDVSSKGKVLLFDVTVQKEGDKTVELGLVFEKDIFHGPVTCLSCLSSEGKNRLVIGAGADINIEQWGNNRLTQVGFFRATMQVLDVFMFKNFLLLSDAYDSLYFLVWRESDKSLTLLSKDYDPLVVYAAGTISRGGSLTFVSHDDRQNLQFFQYAPGEAAARGGNKLVCRADYHLGAQTAAFQNHPCRSSLWVNSASPSSTLAALKQQDAFFGRSEDDQRLGAHFGSSDGGFGSIVPLSEPVYWRLAALQSVMANALENDCALSQRAWRLYARSYRRGGCRSTDRKKGVIDGDLVAKYMDLPLSDQEDLASAIGSTVGLILDNLLELSCAASVI